MKKMRRPLILEAIKKYAARDVARFHMPGHKGLDEFEEIFNGAKTDITELSFSGNLSSEKGLIADAEKQMAEVLGSFAAHIVTDGSSCAIFAMVYAASKRGSKLIIPRISHKSVYNALKLFKMEPVFLPCVEKDGMLIQDVSSLGRILNKEKKAAGVLLTSPDYYGNVPFLEIAADETRKKGKLLLIDGAHGGHLKYAAPHLYAGEFADAWVDGVHKTLPSLTQAAVLGVNDEDLDEDIAEGLSIFRTTSPSYPIMASAEFGVLFAEWVGAEGFRRVADLADKLIDGAAGRKYKFVKTADRCKLLLDCPASGLDAAALVKYLEKHGVYAEFSDGRYIVFMLSVCNVKEDFDMLRKALIAYRRTKFKKAENVGNRPFIGFEPTRVTTYTEAVNAPYDLVLPVNAEGRTAADNFGFFPPCYPVITAGEAFTKELAEALVKADDSFGVKDGRLKVVRNGQ
ncbi:MAG: aminotransferase class I/II-fold pyridoxal phosphate-dependent enzyme [Clostridia bacterium]|nr:aminotransferase class I/II-fold pyridoxal phosphate-dependent enzyme [Clostridia bacterium]